GFAFTDTLVETRNANSMALDSSSLSFGGTIEDTHKGFERAELSGGNGLNRIDTSLFTGPVVLDGGEGDDTLIAGSFDDTLIGSGGNDDLRGGTGDDIYLFDTDSPLGSDSVRDDGGTDWMDFGGTTTAVISVSLLSTAAQSVNSNLILTLAAGDQIDNVRGGALGDTLIGNDLDNTM